MLEMLEKIDSIASRQPGATKARQEIGEVEATALGSGGGRGLKTKNDTIMGPFHKCRCLFGERHFLDTDARLNLM